MPAGYQSQRALGPFITGHNICSFLLSSLPYEAEVEQDPGPAVSLGSELLL